MSETWGGGWGPPDCPTETACGCAPVTHAAGEGGARRTISGVGMLLRGSRSAADSSSCAAGRTPASDGGRENVEALSRHHVAPPGWPGASGVRGRGGRASRDARKARGEKCQEVGCGASRDAVSSGGHAAALPASISPRCSEQGGKRREDTRHVRQSGSGAVAPFLAQHGLRRARRLR